MKDMKITLSADDLKSLMSWVDAAFAVHPDMKSHTGGAICMGRGVIMPKSIKQKLNTKSSTESELVGASDYLAFTIYATLFWGMQGNKIENNIYFQDNESTIRFETNGRNSCGSKSRHINIRYFWIKNRLESENIKVLWYILWYL